MSKPSALLVEESVAAPATAEALEPLHQALERFWRAVDSVLPTVPDSTWRLQLSTAIGEIGANIVQHAHPPGTPATIVCLRLRMFPNRVEVCFTDRGLPYHEPSYMEDLEPFFVDDVLDLMESGYGLSITRRAVDQVKYRRTRTGANVWRLVKRWKTSG